MILAALLSTWCILADPSAGEAPPDVVATAELVLIGLESVATPPVHEEALTEEDSEKEGPESAPTLQSNILAWKLRSRPVLPVSSIEAVGHRSRAHDVLRC